MADVQNKSGNNAAPDPVRDLVALDQEQGAAGAGKAGSSGAGGMAAVGGSKGNSQDSIVNAAAVFEQQLDQMTAWKHQLAAQMEVLRRDGIRILERQKHLAIEKKKLADERAAVQADRTFVQSVHEQLEAERKAIEARAAQVEQARGEVEALASQKSQWLAELNAAKQSAEETAARRDQAAAELSKAEAKLAEFKALETQRAELEGQVQQERAALADAGSEAEAKLAEAQRQLARQSATAEEQLAEATAAMETINEQRARQEQRWTALESRAAELTQQEEAGNRKLAELAEREAALRAGQQEFNAAQATMLEKQERLIAGENALAGRRGELEAELGRNSAGVAELQQQLEGERAALGKTRAEMQKRLEQAEQEHAEQLEILAKQTKRLSERRAELEAATVDLQGAIEQRVARASEGLKEELSRQEAGYEEKIATLAEQVRAADADTAAWRDKEQELLAQVAAAQGHAEAVRAELARTQNELDEAGKQRTDLARDLAEQVMHFEREATEWQRKLDAAIAENQGEQAQKAGEEAEAARTQLNTLQAQLEEVCAAREELAHRLATMESGHAAQIEKLRAEGAQLPAVLGRQLKQMEMQRNEVATQLFATQDMLQRQGEETLLSQGAMEAQLRDVQRKVEELEAEKSRWSTHTKSAATGSAGGAGREGGPADGHHERLLRQARNLRAYRRQVGEIRAALAGQRREVVEQRDQLRSRKENLEQVKRLLEKQEMVMARKLADHNALKTVAAVGIFVIMVLGSVFVSVYKFMNPVYRSEAVVQLAAPAGLQGAELLAWETRQREFLRNNEVTFAAWKVLRGVDEKYAMHDVRDEWLAALTRHLDVQLDTQSRTLAIRYTGSDAQGVAQVCNALAVSLVNPVMRETTEETKSIGAGSTVLAKAMPPMYPAEDRRLMISLGGVAVVLFVSLLFVIMFRHYVARQLREIDQMADEQDLEDIGGELPAEAKAV